MRPQVCVIRLTEKIVVAVQAERIVELEHGWLSTHRIITNPRDF